MELGPLQHEDVDIGDPTPVRCLKNGLWLSKDRDLPFAVLVSSAVEFGTVVVDIAEREIYDGNLEDYH